MVISNERVAVSEILQMFLLLWFNTEFKFIIISNVLSNVFSYH